MQFVACKGRKSICVGSDGKNLTSTIWLGVGRHRPNPLQALRFAIPVPLQFERILIIEHRACKCPLTLKEVMRGQMVEAGYNVGVAPRRAKDSLQIMLP